MERCAIFLEGPIGVGKTTLGRSLARRLSGHFIDGDAYADPSLPWYGSILTTSRGIVEAGLQTLTENPVVLIAYPLRCTQWIFFYRRFGAAGVRSLFISLHAPLEHIVDVARARVFDLDERARSREMIAQGYGRRPFSDLHFATGHGNVEENAATLEAQVRRLLQG